MPGKMITLKGIKPIGKIQWKEGKFYVYGVVDPELGEGYFEKYFKLKTEIFKKFLNKFSQRYSENFNLIIMDNGSFHKEIDLTSAR